jgi:hypothetical protein
MPVISYSHSMVKECDKQITANTSNTNKIYTIP